MRQQREDKLVTRCAKAPAKDMLCVAALEIRPLAAKLVSSAERQHGDAHKSHALRTRGTSGICPGCEKQFVDHQAAGDAKTSDGKIQLFGAADTGPHGTSGFLPSFLPAFLPLFLPSWIACLLASFLPSGEGSKMISLALFSSSLVALGVFFVAKLSNLRCA